MLVAVRIRILIEIEVANDDSLVVWKEISKELIKKNSTSKTYIMPRFQIQQISFVEYRLDRIQ